MPYPVVFPGDFVQKVLSLEAPGGSPTRAMIVIPTVVRPQQPVPVNLALLDENGFPVVGSPPPLTLTFPREDGGEETQTIEFPAGRPAVCRIEGVRFFQPGFVRLEADLQGHAHYSNPALVGDGDRPQILWGDPHIHTVLSDCHPDRCRSRVLAYTAARHAYGLDFVAIADHVSGGKRGSIGKWRDNLAMAELFHQPPAFSTLLCYEASMPSGQGGDNNVYPGEPRESYVDPGDRKLNVHELANTLPDGDFVVPHHTSRAKKHGELPPALYPGEQKMPVVEIHSKWGCSEYRGHPESLEDPHDGPSYVQDLLACGYRLGFIGGTDAHTSLTFCQSLEAGHIRHLPGLTAVLCDNNERACIHTAIASRNCYAASGERIFLEVLCNGLRMGRCARAANAEDPRRIEVRCAAQSDIDAIEIVRNGRCIHSLKPGAWHAEYDWCDDQPLAECALCDAQRGTPFVYYYLRVTAVSGAQAWSSPCWLELPQPGPESEQL
jgi:hypothetical protein